MNKAPVKRGQCILREKPFVYALKSRFRTERCDFCFNEGEVLKCSNCKYVYYCSRTCQKESWPMHKHECAYLGKILPKIVPDAARVIARILLKLNGDGAEQKGFYTEQDYRKFKDLMPHYENLIRKPERIEHIQSLIMVLKHLLPNSNVPSDKEIVLIYGRMAINSFNVLDNELNSLGTAIYLGASICDHSCRPNAVATFVGTTLEIHALAPMATLNWSKIRISYIDLVQPTALRQKELNDNYFFCCDCDRCKDPRESIEMNAAACPNVKCPTPQYFDSNPAAVELHCNNCHTKIDSAHIKSFEEILDCTKMHLSQMKDIAYLDVCTVMLKKQQNVFHPTNVWHIKTIDMAFESAINVGKLDVTLDYGNVLVNGLRKYGGDFNPMLGLVYTKIGKIQLLKGHAKEALHNLNRASDILSITHGRDHNLYRQHLVPLLIEANVECD